MCHIVNESEQNPVGAPLEELNTNDDRNQVTGVYVDVENLQGGAKEVIESLLASWPALIPKPSHLNLYVRADLASLWDIWAANQFKALTVHAKGIQHFSHNPAKNSGDIAIAMDAISDFLLGKVTYIVVVSDDSDFISLYAKIMDDKALIGYRNDQTPFLWVLTDRDGTRSSTIQEYFPASSIHVVPFPKEEISTLKGIAITTSPLPLSSKVVRTDPWEDMCRAIVEGIPLGPFKSTDCQIIIKGKWPSHHLANATGPAFGTEFIKMLLPILERHGVISNDGRPRKYEMTQVAKISCS